MIRVSTLKIRQGRRVDQAKLDELLGRCRVLYNAALEERIDAWRKQHKSLSLYDQQKELTEIRHADPVYSSMDAIMTRLTVLRRLDLAFKSFFRRCKSGETPGFPRFRGRDRFDTLVFGNTGWKLRGHKLTIRGAGWFRVTNLPHRDGKLIGLRLVKKEDRWYAHVLVDVGAAPAVKPATNGIGIDVGIRTFATMSDGVTVEHPRFLGQSTEVLAAAQQDLSRKQRGSNRRRKSKTTLTRMHAKIANRRRDFVWQTVVGLVKKYDGFAVEKLQIAEMVSTTRDVPEGMTKKQFRGMRRGIMDSAWGMFALALACKAEEAGMPFVAVNPKGTSQRCSSCGSVVRKTLRDREHNCAACGLIMDRDENAARNIYDLGLKVGGVVDRGEFIVGAP